MNNCLLYNSFLGEIQNNNKERFINKKNIQGELFLQLFKTGNFYSDINCSVFGNK